MSIKSMLSVTLSILLFSSAVIAIAPAARSADTEPPWVVSHYPPSGAIDVPVTAQIFINFSEPMNIVTVVVDIQPFIILSPAWAMGMNLALMHPVDFLACTYYTVNVTGDDLAGNPLDGNHDGIGGDPFVWSFTTDCGGPYIIRTVPEDGETDVPLVQPIIVTFSKRTNPAIMTVSIIPAIMLTMVWNLGGTELTMTHAVPFQTCTIYTITIISSDLVPGPIPPGPVPNSWHFTTTGCQPVITGIYPPQADATIDATIRVDFSATMNNATVTWNLNRTLTLVPSWSPGNKTLSLTHVVKFLPCTSYGFTVTGKDMFGQTLDNGSFPMPYNFTTICTYPKVTDTSPRDGQINVPLDAPIVVTFSESMDAQSVEDSLIYSDGLAFFTKLNGTSAWNLDSTVFTFSPSSPYRRDFSYTVRLKANNASGLGNNHLDGNGNGIPEYSPDDDKIWQFKAAQVSDTIPPSVQSVSPGDGAVEVPRTTSVIVIFTEAMNQLSVRLAIQVSGGSGGHVAYNFSWPNNRTVSFNLIPQLIYSNAYTITIQKSAADLVGNEMFSNFVWTFTAESWRGDVYGVVVDDSTGEPIANATVTFNGVPTLTDENGSFTFRNVQEGTYRLDASKEGYDLSTSTHTVAPDFQDLGTIRLKKTGSIQQNETPWLLVSGLAIAVMIVLTVIILLSRKRRKVQPTDFEQWKGEVAEAERPGPEQ